MHAVLVGASKSISTNVQYVTLETYFSHPSFSYILGNYFPTPPTKLKLGLQVGGRLLVATHSEQSNYLPNQKQGAVNEYDLTVFMTLFEGSGKI
jgi:hypothetical protein